MLASKSGPETPPEAAGQDTRLTMPASVHLAIAARHKGWGGGAPACTEFQAGILAPGPMTPGTEGESWATSGNNSALGVL